MHPKYRPDIDGLRAIAVGSVLVYHAFPTALMGGFIGVDIFFVISGFLITTIILQSLAVGDFSYRDFYARRIRRIFPALLVVLFATLCAGWYLLLSDEFAELGKQTVGGAAFVANFVFWGESGYFDTAAETKPLLHLWSLGIEEQFYIFWPLLLGLAWRKGWPIVRVVLAVAAVSFVVNVTTVHPLPAASFYSPASRFWELMVGGILACMRLKPPTPSAWRSHVQSVVGVGLIVLGLVMIRSTKAFPGWWALLPTLGAVSCIAAGPNGVLNKYLLSNRVMVWIGLISYPLYLWHWPLLAFVRIVEADPLHPSPVYRAGAMVASVLLAWATYRFIERYARNRPGPGILKALGAGMVLIAALSAAIFFGAPQPRNSSERLQIVANATLDADYYAGFKLDQIGEQLVYKTGSGPKRVLFVGDSHVQQYAPRVMELSRTLAMPDKSAWFVTQGACPAVPGVYADKNIGCAERRDAMLAYAMGPEIDSVVIGGCWNCYFVGHGALEYYYRGPDNQVHPFQGGDGIERALVALEATLRELARHKKVFLLLDNPGGPEFTPKRLIEGSRLTHMEAMTSSPTVPLPADQKQLNDRLRAIAGASGAEPIDAMAVLCKDGSHCLVTLPDGAPAYKDADHLRPRYTREEASYFDPTVRAAPAQQPSR
ncbi:MULTISPECIES: acyltransferase family protein [unclassified Variovorax]|jgi:peptidoglycan/LPS O-acetylase OafA/YrhL|uniref:acyltransferase family protein n=1 Tax=unclassified Variovorax TaxID=663243 RepID=UPI000F7EC685|nr:MULTISPECIES: acyltransferase family protein [unclassified Variovorax]RSZ47078.1 acyltransferase [Variovorax sp. 553]RSZ48800.1 acyltransferase [Variovorax sp. 679]